MIEKKDGLDILKKKSNSPYDPEPPVENFIVNLFMKFGKKMNKGGLCTPHLYGDSDLKKVEYEYNSAPYFFEIMEDYIGIDVFDHKAVLDAGCGWGGKTIYFAENSKLKSISGFDLPEAYIPEISVEFASEKQITNCFFKTGYAEDMPYDNDKFDVLIMDDVLEHVNDPEKVITECYRVLKPGGMIIIKFPSFKMMFAHHLDRALTFPALHYILPMKKWAAGLNYLLLAPENNLSYEPFDEVIKTKYCKSITRNLNGLDIKNFREIIGKSNFKSRVLELVPFKKSGKKIKITRLVYDMAWKIGFCKEFLSGFIVFIGEKKAS